MRFSCTLPKYEKEDMRVATGDRGNVKLYSILFHFLSRKLMTEPTIFLERALFAGSDEFANFDRFLRVPIPVGSRTAAARSIALSITFSLPITFALTFAFTVAVVLTFPLTITLSVPLAVPIAISFPVASLLMRWETWHLLLSTSTLHLSQQV
jgi:hypothetical protein